MQPLHRLKLAWSTQAWIEIEWTSGLSGPTVHGLEVDNLIDADSEASLDSVGRLGIPAICVRDRQEILFEPLQLREQTEYLVDILVPSTMAAATSAWQENKTWPLSPRLADHYKTDPPKRWVEADGGVRLTGHLNFKSYVGVANLGLTGHPPLLVEVVCAKIGYFSDFRRLLEQVAEETVALLLDVDTPTFVQFGTDQMPPEVSPAESLFHLRRIMADRRLPSAVEAVLQSPHSVTRIREELVPPAWLSSPAVDRLTTALASLDFQEGGPLASLFRGYTPSLLPNRQVEDTTDTQENRYVKAFLEDLLQQAERLAVFLETADKRVGAGEARQWAALISDWLGRSVWREVGRMTHFPSNSQVLQRRQGYREVLDADLTLQTGLQLPWLRGAELADGLDGDIRPIHELYEYWCFFVLRRALREICGSEVRNSSLFDTRMGGLTLVLRKSASSKSVFELTAPGKRALVSLYYNRTFRRSAPDARRWDGSYSASFHPDYSILVEVFTAENRRASAQRHWLHFDAKYRLDQHWWRTEIEPSLDTAEADIIAEDLTPLDQIDEERRDTYKRDDLYKMHTYRDALLGSRGAYVLFPGSGEAEDVFLRQPGQRYPTAPFAIPAVGALQLRPENTDRQYRHLKDFLSKILAQMLVNIDYKEEIGFF